MSLWHPTLVSSTLEARLIHHLVKATLLEIVSALHHHLTVSVLHVLALAGGLLLYTKGVIRFVLHDISLISLRQGFLWLTHQKLCWLLSLTLTLGVWSAHLPLNIRFVYLELTLAWRLLLVAHSHVTLIRRTLSLVNISHVVSKASSSVLKLLVRCTVCRRRKSLLMILMDHRLLLISKSAILGFSERLLIICELRLLSGTLFFRLRHSYWGLFERVYVRLMNFPFEDAVLFLEGVSHLGDAWRDVLKEKLDNLLSLVFKQHLKVFDHQVACWVTLYSDCKDVVFNLRHRWLTNQFFILLAEHNFALLL